MYMSTSHRSFDFAPYAKHYTEELVKHDKFITDPAPTVNVNEIVERAYSDLVLEQELTQSGDYATRLVSSWVFTSTASQILTDILISYLDLSKS